MSQFALSDHQFEGYTGGPQEARRIHEGGPEKAPGPPRLFDPESVARPEAHQQTPEQFAKDPRTWWHGRVTKGGPRGRLGGSGIGRGEGFHAGIEAAARMRLEHVTKRREPPEGMAGRLYPLRITGRVTGPEDLHPDVERHLALSPVGGRTKGYLYKNLVEAPGSISVGVPRRKGFLSTQREMVQQAQKEGKPVHPNIAWAVKTAPEHTGEKYPEKFNWEERMRHRQLSGEQLHLTQQAHEGPRLHELSDVHRQMFPQREPIQRTSFERASGRTQHVWRYREEGPGTALNPRQWQ